MVKINGEEKDAAGVTVERYLKDCGFDAARVAVEVNGEIVRKSDYSAAAFKDGDVVEIVSFVGGG
ncbi:MAG: sulfur carrier protein ThiS [Clostridia bacterium]|nr:sulfur carrier protein ThiS [Clostridia bacterium]